MSCQSCGGVSTRELESVVYGVEQPVIESCDKCMEDFLDGLQFWRAEFVRLQATGIPRQEASEMLSVRIKAGEQPPRYLS